MRDINALNLDDKISVPVALAFPPNSEILETFSFFLLKLRETGVLQKIKKNWNLARQPKQREEMQESGTVLGFENLSFPFLILAFGTISASTLAVIENLLRKIHRGGEKVSATW